MGPEPKVRESAEDYLEAMLMLKKERGYVRAVDVANHLGVTKPSVTYATKRLKEEGHLYVDEYGMIQLTETGLAIANRIYERHTVLAGLFESLGVSPEVALEDACKVEHDLSEETFAAIKKHAKEKGAL